MIAIQPIKNVPIDYIEVDTKNRILDVKPARVKILVESLEQVGRIFTPLFVTLNTGTDSYRLVSGATRLAAAKQLGWYEVPIVVISGTDDEIKQVEVEENLGRHDLTDNERERLEHVRKMCRANIDAAVAKVKAYAAAHPKETAKALAEAKEIGEAAASALRRRPTKKTARGERPKRKHRKTGRKSIAAHARETGAKPNTVQKRIRREKGAKKDGATSVPKSPKYKRGHLANNKDFDPEFVEYPTQIRINILDSISRSCAVAGAYKKILKVAFLDQEVKDEVRTAIGKMIAKWQSLQAGLAPADIAAKLPAADEPQVPKRPLVTKAADKKMRRAWEGEHPDELPLPEHLCELEHPNPGYEETAAKMIRWLNDYERRAGG